MVKIGEHCVVCNREFVALSGGAVGCPVCGIRASVEERAARAAGPREIRTLGDLAAYLRDRDALLEAVCDAGRYSVTFRMHGGCRVVGESESLLEALGGAVAELEAIFARRERAR